jgi:hypothetical protein
VAQADIWYNDEEITAYSSNDLEVVKEADLRKDEANLP